MKRVDPKPATEYVVIYRPYITLRNAPDSGTRDCKVARAVFVLSSGFPADLGDAERGADMTVTLELVSLVLAIVALIVTVLGFFASLKFYRDGAQTQTAIDKLLSKLEVRIDSISAQVGGLFETTLKAALQNPPGRVEAQAREVSREPDPNNPSGLLISEIDEKSEPGRTISALFSLRGLQFSNVEVQPAQLLFQLGRDQSFNLFNGPALPYVFYGHFYLLDSVEALSRVRTLFSRLRDLIARFDPLPPEPQRDQLLGLLRGIEVHVLIPDDLDPKLFEERALESHSGQPFKVKAMTREDVQASHREEIERLKRPQSGRGTSRPS